MTPRSRTIPFGLFAIAVVWMLSVILLSFAILLLSASVGGGLAW
jgi:hypothetical protein